MSKRELIDAIRMHNRSVAPEFLARFADTDLKAYLDRVALVCGGSVGPPGTAPPRVSTTVDCKQELVLG